MPADPDTLPLLPRGNTGAYLVDDPRHFMAWDPRVLNSGPGAFCRQQVTVADTAGLYFDPNLPFGGLRHLALDDLEARSRF